MAYSCKWSGMLNWRWRWIIVSTEWIIDSKLDQITGIMYDKLHWLLARQHIVFKLCTLTLASMCRHTWQTASHCQWWLVTHVYGRAHAVTWELRTVSCHIIDHASLLSLVLHAWNSLPTAVRGLSSLHSCFCSRLKTELLCRAYGN